MRHDPHRFMIGTPQTGNQSNNFQVTAQHSKPTSFYFRDATNPLKFFLPQSPCSSYSIVASQRSPARTFHYLRTSHLGFRISTTLILQSSMFATRSTHFSSSASPGNFIYGPTRTCLFLSTLHPLTSRIDLAEAREIWLLAQGPS